MAVINLLFLGFFSRDARKLTSEISKAKELTLPEKSDRNTSVSL